MMLTASSLPAVRDRAGTFIRLALALAVAVLVSACSTTTTSSQKSLVIPAAEPSKYAALVIDASSRKVLYQVSAGSSRYPASLTKMMTMYLLFEALDSGRVSKATLIPFSQNAASEPPTKLGVRSGDAVDVDTILRALAVKSANDAATAIGEYLAGSEESFAAAMTAKARSLGMSATYFRNASGLHDPEQRTTARDMATLGMALRARFPHHFHYFSETEVTFRGKLVRGHNDMLGRVAGVDGIKTGYVKASGYNIVTSVRTGGRVLIIVVMGADSARARNAHVEELIDRYGSGPARPDPLTALLGGS